MKDALIEEIVKQVLKSLEEEKSLEGGKKETPSNEESEALIVNTDEMKKEVLVDNPYDKDLVQAMKKNTCARIGVGRAGARLKTATYLAARVDHARAIDAVWTEVSEKTLKELSVVCVQTKCDSKHTHLTRPDLGRELNDEGRKEVLTQCKKNVQVQIILADGLSSEAISKNAQNVLLPLLDILASKKITVGKPFFVKYARVGVMDDIATLLNSEVTCILVGERPGLATDKSLSAYIAYDSHKDKPESNRTVVSNIHEGGMPAVEAGAYIAQVIEKILEHKKSGVALML